MTLAEAASIAESTIHLVAGCAGPSHEARSITRNGFAVASLAAIRRYIDAQLHNPPSMLISSPRSSHSHGQPSIAFANHLAECRPTSGAGGSRAASRSSSHPHRTSRAFPRLRSDGGFRTRPVQPCLPHDVRALPQRSTGRGVQVLRPDDAGATERADGRARPQQLDPGTDEALR